MEGYCSDITRTFLFGDDKKHEDFKRAYAEVLKAHELVKEKLTSGMTGKEADEIARGSLRQAGLDKLFTHSLGHGVGLLIHEFPRLSPSSEEVLSDGMVFSDEPASTKRARSASASKIRCASKRAGCIPSWARRREISSFCKSINFR